MTNISGLTAARLAYTRSRLDDELRSCGWREERTYESLVAVAALLDTPEAESMPADLRAELVDALAEPFAGRVDFPRE